VSFLPDNSSRPSRAAHAGSVMTNRGFYDSRQRNTYISSLKYHLRSVLVTAAFYREIETAARTQVLSNQNHWGLALYQFAPIGLQFESLRARCHVQKGMARI
jgi:hypothetical protein